MTDRTDSQIEDLIARLEKATSANFALDCEIYESFMLPDKWFGSKVENWFGHGSGIYSCNTADGYGHIDCLRAHAFTSSIDAALTLVPEGWFWRAGVTSIYKAWAHVHKTHPDHGEPGKNEFGWKRELWEPDTNPAIALCIAALKARARAEEEKG